MNADALVQWLLNGAVATSAALLLVLALRLPLRRAFGARIAYAAWALVPLALLAVTLPAPRAATALLRALPVLSTLRPAVVVGAPVPLDGGAAAAASAPLLDWPLLLALAWYLGAALLALRFAAQQRRYLAALGELRPRGDGTFAANVGQSPAVIGAWRPRIVLPADFDARYPREQAGLVVAHERTHVRRGDVRANLAVAALRCLHWFNPLLHAAAARFRLDQELACDAAVLARHPNARRAYADAMLNTQLAVPGLPVGCHWQSSQSLKERIMMLKQPLPGRARRGAGLAVLVVALAAGSYGAWALQPAAVDQAPAYLGNVLWGNLADVDVRLNEKNGEPIKVSGGAFAKQQQSEDWLRAYMNGASPLRMEIGSGKDALVFEAQATDTLSEIPVVVWTLRQHGQRIDQGRISLSRDPQTLVVGGADRGTTSSATLTFRAAAETTLLGQTQPLATDSPGHYVLEDGVVVGDEYKTAGSADLLLHISPDGVVSKVDIERVSPPKAFTPEQADEYVYGMRFRPFTEGGRQAATLARTTVHFAPTTEAVEHPPAWFKPAPAAKQSQAVSASEATPRDATTKPQSLKPPKYPADAAANKISGKVVLLVDVATDGSVRNVEVESSKPAGVFDQVAVDAAKEWTINPELKGGKPIAGRVRVPVTFDASWDGQNPGTPMKMPPGRAEDPSAYDWIKYDPAVDKRIRSQTCDIVQADPETGVSYCGKLKQLAGAP
jgi:TonB family protein